MSASVVIARCNCRRVPRSGAFQSAGEYKRRPGSRRSLKPRMQTRHSSDNARPRLTPGVRLQIDRKTGKAVLLFPEGILELNETAQAILSYCDGKTLGEIASLLGQEYEANHGTIMAEIRDTLDDLHQRRLIEFA
ncbi:MAG: pyrroloquinoline quinone biosynthesis peptide chaperone PqqD [Chthoniobacterales bacterium]